MLQLLREPDMNSYVSEIMCKYSEHPDCSLFYSNNHFDLPNRHEHLGWSSDMFIIYLNSKRVGYAGWSISQNARSIKHIEIIVEPDYHKRGIGIVVSCALIHYLLVQRKFRKIIFSAMPENARQYIRTGLQPVGILKDEYYPRNGIYADEYIFEIFPETLQDPRFARYVNLHKRVSFF